MKFRVPIVVTEQRVDGQPLPGLTARPVFLSGLQREGERLPRVLEQLARDLRDRVGELAKAADGFALARLATPPELQAEVVPLRLELKTRTLQLQLFVVSWEAHGQLLACAPEHPETVFQISSRSQLPDRTRAVFHDFFRAHERAGRTWVFEEAAAKRKQWLTELELEVRLRPPPKEKPVDLSSLFGAKSEVTGDVELERTGRCLDRLYPDDLSRALCRDAEVAELHRLLTAPERRPILLLGPAQCGKTTLVHEFVARRAAAARSERRYDRRSAVWLLSPQRLVSGMSYVGQWEERLLAILGEAKKRDHTLYFEDLAGLWLAGQSSCSANSMAQLLKPWVERGEVRLLAELTPEAWRVQRELDRGFADLFHVLPVREPGERDNLRILLGVQRALEREQRCRFEVDALPAVLDVQRRHSPELSFPGKAAGFLRALAAKFTGRSIDSASVLAEFRARTGLTVGFLATERPLSRKLIATGLAQSLVGQEPAVRALADALSLARARLQDPRRPLGALLLVGPTGVGKTQAARAAAQFLFGDASRLLRFDMNEFVSADAAARLVGTFAEPEGLLTSAVRRQPFCVLLLDEIEKAHPAVFDLLLQVLGEGRLTDALGRTTSFANALILLTSNLGVRESGRTLGFRGEDEAAAAAHFVRAAERFFRPEFVNRLDRIVPFARLSRAEVGRIAERVLAEVFARDGLRQRQCFLRLDAAARAQLVEVGFHPELGARALKRAVERHLVQPVATRLAALRPEQRCLVAVRFADGAFRVTVEGLTEAPWRGLPPALAAGEPARFVGQMRAARDRLSAAIDRLSPSGPISLDAVTPAQRRYFALREHLTEIDELWPERLPETSAGGHHPRWKQPALTWNPDQGELRAQADFRDQQQETEAVDPEAAPALDDRWGGLLRRLSLLGTMLQADPEERVLLLREQPVGETRRLPWAAHVFDEGDVSDLIGFSAVGLPELERQSPLDPGRWLSGTVLTGPGALALGRAQTGLHLQSKDGGVEVFEAHALPLAADADPLQVARSAFERFSALPPLRQIIGIATPEHLIDLRSGHRVASPADAAGLRELLLSALPWPNEVTDDAPFSPS
ncbi:MAG: ATP-dependent Clp protease ATP-binding subunit [Verrucomicrobia bacterium]|nr:ATP-dependent Clp protease ATP-binding subunit [Verrucomicrobiota bacterium]